MSKFYKGNQVSVYNNGGRKKDLYLDYWLGRISMRRKYLIWDLNFTRKPTHINNSWQNALDREKIEYKCSSTGTNSAVQETEINPAWLEQSG